MKILLVNKYHYIKGGSETYHFGLAKLLERHGHEVIFFAMADEQNMDCAQSGYFSKNVDFNGDIGAAGKLKAGLHALYSFDAKKKIAKLIEDERPDLVHINLVHRHLTLSVLDAIQKYNLPVVHTVHDANSICLNHAMMTDGKICDRCVTDHSYRYALKHNCVKGSKLQTLLALAEAENYNRRKSYNKIDCYICPSRFYQNELALSGITDSPIVHMTNFLPEDTVYEASADVRDYFLYFGRLSFEKGVLTLIKAYDAGHFDNPLYLVGTGPLRDELEAYVREHNLQDRVLFKGFQSGDELKNTVARAKCVILPSEWHENCPYSIMEAQASGKPVIVSNIGGLPELVQDGVSGFFCEPFDPDSLCAAMRKLNELNANEYRAMSQAAVQNAKALCDSEAYYEKLTELYKKLIAEKQRG